MMTSTTSIALVALLAASLSLSACSRSPQETEDMSSATGTDTTLDNAPVAETPEIIISDAGVSSEMIDPPETETYLQPVIAADSENLAIIEDATDVAEARLYLPAELVRDHPRIGERLDTDARAIFEAFHAEARAFKSETETLEFEFRPWSLTHQWFMGYHGSDLVSLVLVEDSYMGGAHPNMNFATTTLDPQSLDGFGLERLIRDFQANSDTLTALSETIRADLLSQRSSRTGLGKGELMDDWFMNETAPMPDLFDNFVLLQGDVDGAIGGVAFYYAPYAIGPYAEGPYVAVVEADVLRDLVSDEWRTRIIGPARSIPGFAAQ